MKNYLLLLFFFVAFYSVKSQTNDSIYKKQIKDNIEKQLIAFPQEKLHLHTDKSVYMADEKVWFSAYLVDALTHQPAFASRYIYVELVNSLNSIVNRVMVKPEGDSFNGHIQLDENMPEGKYMLRAYTKYMENQGGNYFFIKPIYIGSIFASNFTFDLQFDAMNTVRNKTKFSFSIKNVNTGEKSEGDNVGVSVNGQDIKINKSKDTIYSGEIDRNKIKNNQYVKILAGEYSRYFRLPDIEDDFSVSFFPEGGYMLLNKVSRIAFKAINSKGMGENVSGVIVNNLGDTIQKISSYHLGMGMVSIIPNENQQYVAICKNDAGVVKQFQLPDAQNNAAMINVFKGVGEKINLSVAKTDNYSNSPLYLLIHSKGIVQYFERWDDKIEYGVIDKTTFPSGIAQILLLDSQMNVLSERLVFCNNNDQSIVTIECDANEYTKRAKGIVNVKITDANERALGGTFSVSITDDYSVAPDSTASILSRLLLSSELKGYIESPMSYFDKSNKLSALSLDVLMMTQGWRRYDVPNVLKGQLATPGIEIEKSMAISGNVKGLLNFNKVANSDVTIIPFSGEFTMAQVKTNAEGNFKLSNFEFPDSTVYMIQAKTARGGGMVALQVDTMSKFPKITNNLPFEALSFHDKSIDEFAMKGAKRYTTLNGMKMIQLNAFEIIGKKKRVVPIQHIDSRVLDATTIEKGGLKSMRTFLEFNMPNELRNIYRNPEAQILCRVNGFDSDIDFVLNNLLPQDIEQIEMVKSMFSQIYGFRAKDGAILITTKLGAGTAPAKGDKANIARINPLGFQKPVEFYSPKYESSEEMENPNIDLRSTVLWKPMVQLDVDGTASFDFYANDVEKTTYTILIEGVSNCGKIIYSKSKVKIK